MYYLRTRPAAEAIKFTVDRKLTQQVQTQQDAQALAQEQRTIMTTSLGPEVVSDTIYEKSNNNNDEEEVQVCPMRREGDDGPCGPCGA
jgi:hypothetical protein